LQPRDNTGTPTHLAKPATGGESPIIANCGSVVQVAPTWIIRESR
jgi:hypothetical protein